MAKLLGSKERAKFSLILAALAFMILASVALPNIRSKPAWADTAGVVLALGAAYGILIAALYAGNIPNSQDLAEALQERLQGEEKTIAEWSEMHLEKRTFKARYIKGKIIEIFFAVMLMIFLAMAILEALGIPAPFTFLGAEGVTPVPRFIPVLVEIILAFLCMLAITISRMRLVERVDNEFNDNLLHFRHPPV